MELLLPSLYGSFILYNMPVRPGGPPVYPFQTEPENKGNVWIGGHTPLRLAPGACAIIPAVQSNFNGVIRISCFLGRDRTLAGNVCTRGLG
jgi:hypothetical protein